jgi:hypothetical protein
VPLDIDGAAMNGIIAIFTLVMMTFLLLLNIPVASTKDGKRKAKARQEDEVSKSKKLTRLL